MDREKKRLRKSWKYDPRRHRSKNYTIYSTYLLRYGIVLVPAGIGCIINGRERGKGCSADTADRLSADLGTSTTDIFVQRSRTLKWNIDGALEQCPRPNVFFFFLFPFPFFRSMIMRLQPADIESRMKYRRDGGKINSRLLFEGTGGNWKYSYNDFYIVTFIRKFTRYKTNISSIIFVKTSSTFFRKTIFILSHFSDSISKTFYHVTISTLLFHSIYSVERSCLKSSYISKFYFF